ncbi:hypothetical protein Daura_46360 [Dactylosporangium aurantiacum]|uniref:Secreted protein n=1 Tax=Dactylosporangium aurantiacum TaxID=35754 RepID=A0A9Q9MIN4_9ACTN|nr:hypothetical protein [Dactylosporangium aurantiacum]MDG6108160.1 hypothetical protein [Dactylosporangium aurantiacum]UWZ53846.1 hypothetical protein Daura_46360 [Dactylosporangium aurantiacum]
MSPVNRRQVLVGAAGVAGALAIPSIAPQAAHAAVPAGFPTYAYLGQPLPASLAYNPTGELIFPCIRGMYDKISGARGRYYLYYAPHDAPGGICLAYGNSLSGPFTEYPANPIISRTWSPYYSVSHVSSPHVLWNAATRQFFMYYHGENTTTRLAISSDGIHFTYYGTVLTTAMVPGTSETTYARVFEHRIAGLGNTYVMVFMGLKSGRRIFWGWSNDGKSWQFDPNPLVSPAADGQSDLSGPHLLYRNNTTYVVYHGSSGDMFLTEVGNNFDKEIHLGVFHAALSGAPDNNRSAAPSFGTDGGVQYMFYEAGQRSSTKIAVARAV